MLIVDGWWADGSLLSRQKIFTPSTINTRHADGSASSHAETKTVDRVDLMIETTGGKWQVTSVRLLSLLSREARVIGSSLFVAHPPDSSIAINRLPHSSTCDQNNVY
jgi:hypothetical protein